MNLISGQAGYKQVCANVTEFRTQTDYKTISKTEVVNDKKCDPEFKRVCHNLTIPKYEVRILQLMRESIFRRIYNPLSGTPIKFCYHLILGNKGNPQGNDHFCCEQLQTTRRYSEICSYLP